MSKSLLDEPVVIHSSHEQIILDSTNTRHADNVLPSIPGAGIILRVGVHPRLSSVVYELVIESPSLSSPSQGEFFDLSTDMERRIQSEQLRIAARCREIADVALHQAERLEALAVSGQPQVSSYDLAKWQTSKRSGSPVSALATPTAAANPVTNPEGINLGRLSSLLKG